MTTRVQRSERTLSVLNDLLLLPYCFVTVSLIEPGARLVDRKPQRSSVFTHHSTGVTSPAYFVNTGALKSDSHACTLSLKEYLYPLDVLEEEQ